MSVSSSSNVPNSTLSISPVLTTNQAVDMDTTSDTMTTQSLATTPTSSTETDPQVAIPTQIKVGYEK